MTKRRNLFMVRAWFCTLAVLLGLVATGTPAVWAQGKKSTATKKTMLFLQSQSPLITFRVVVRAGSAFDPAGKYGVAALTASLLAEGGTQAATYKEMLEKLFPMAASIGVVTDKETVTFVGEVHKDHLDKFYPMFADVLLKPRFDKSEFERLRDDAVNRLEKNLRGTNDEELGKQAFEIELFQGHPYGHAVTGTVESLKKLTLDDVKAFYAANYTRAAIKLAAAGDVPAPVLARMEKDFSTLPAGKPVSLAPVSAVSLDGLDVTLIEKETDATAISLGYQLPLTRKDKDFYALLVANSFLGEHRTFNGLLMNNMRGKRGLNYGDYSYVEHFFQEGGSTFALPNTPRSAQYFSIWIRPVPNAVRLFALRQAMWETDRYIQKGMTEAEFESTRKFLLNYSRLWTQTLSRRLGYRLDSQFYGIDDYIAAIQTNLPKLTVKDVNAALRKYLNARNFKVVMVTRDAEGLKKQMLSGAVSPMKYDSETPAEILAEDKEIEKFPLAVKAEKIRIVPVAQVFEK
ncbi:MAG: insulinase family protein [Blastocatellia bacterium]|nr:insulinase family protein [Blastocatellia bacterium]